MSVYACPRADSAVFVSLSQWDLSCWSVSVWLHLCVCLLDVPRLPPCWTLADFKRQKGNLNWFVLTNCCPLPVWLLTLLFPAHVLSAFHVSPVSHYLPVDRLFPCKQKDRKVKGKNGPFTAVEAGSVSYTRAVMEFDGKLRPNSSEIRQRKPGRASDQLHRWEPMTAHNRSTSVLIKSRTQQPIRFQISGHTET